MNDININELVARYTELRNKKAKMEAYLKEQIEPLERELSAIEGLLSTFLHETNQSSAVTDSGTAYISCVMSATVCDMGAFVSYVIKNKAYQLLEKRVNKSAVKELLDKEVLVDGVKIDTFERVNIRKKS